MSLSTPTPRTDGEITFTGTNTELATLRTERDQLRAIFPQICAALGNGAFCTPTVSVAFIESIPNEVQAVVGKLRAEVERLHGCCEELHTIIDNHGYPSGTDYAKMEARAERAEAALADAQPKSDHYMSSWLERAAARAEKAEAELATERARLDWLESPAGFDWQWNSAHSVIVRRAAIDAAIKEGAK